MGNASFKKNNNPISCFTGVVPLQLLLTNPSIKLILCEGTTRVLTPPRRKRIKAGEIMFEFPDCVVCHADSFFLGRPIPILSIHEELVGGRTYFVLPLDRLPPPEGGGSSGGARVGLLSAASLSSLGTPSPGSSCPTRRSPVINFSSGYKCYTDDDDNGNGNGNCNGKSPFEYIKDKDGRVYMIKVVPEFIARIITNNYEGMSPKSSNSTSQICSTPELQKQYEQLVKAKDQAWSPKLETISEYKIRFSPCRFIGLEWKQKEKEAQYR